MVRIKIEQLTSEKIFCAKILAGESGSADSVRDPRGFAIKMYTDEGLKKYFKN